MHPISELIALALYAPVIVWVHELGHALGLTHNCVSRDGKRSAFGLPNGHVMSATLARADFRAEGTRAAFEEGLA